MKKISKIFTLLLVLTLSISILGGCAIDELALLDSKLKQSDITSCESKTELTLSMSAVGLSDQDKEAFAQVLPLINGMKLVVNQKLSGNSDKTISKSQSDISADISGINTTVSAWSDSDLTGKIPKVKQVIKVPPMASMYLPQEQRKKEYMVIDTAELLPETDSVALGKSTESMLNLSKELTPKLISFIKEFAKSFNPGFSIVTRKETKIVDNHSITVYNLKLDDATFKKFLAYTVKSFAESELTINFIKDLAIASIDVADLSYKEKMKAKGEINKSFSEYKEELPEFLKTWNDVTAILKDVKILGDKGINIDYGINSEGYIVSESGTLDFIINSKEYMDAEENFKALNDKDYIKKVNKDEGTVKLGITFNTVYSKINKDVVIEYPELTPENSFSFKEINLAGKNMLEKDSGGQFESDTTPPAAPTVNKILKTSKTVSGKSEPFSIITITKGKTVLGQGMTDEKGAFTVNIDPVKTQCTLKITSTDIYGNESKAVTVNVK